jgi:hypothetical protein
MPAAINPTFVAGGTINPCRFVTMNTILSNGVTTPTSADFTVFQSGAGTASKGDQGIGISQEGTADWLNTFAANTGQPQIRIFGPGEIGLVECGGTVTAGAWVKSDANGRAVACTTDLDYAMGLALQSGNSSGPTKIQVYVHPHVWDAQ